MYGAVGTDRFFWQEHAVAHPFIGVIEQLLALGAKTSTFPVL